MPALPLALLAFRFIAATVDGGAWLVSEQDDHTWTLERVVSDGGRFPVKLEGIEQIDAIGTRGDTLWIVGPNAVLVRSPKGETKRVDVPVNEQSWGLPIRETTVTPLGNHRAYVMRPCAKAQTRIDDCTEVLTVDAVAGTVTARVWPVQLTSVVPDERGGAWMRVEHGKNAQHRESIGYAHATDGGWDLWSFDGLIVPGMMAHPKTEAFPEHLAAAADGFIGVSQHAIWPIDENGMPRVRHDYDEIGHRGTSVVHGVASSGGEVVLLTGIFEGCCFDDVEYDDVSPVLRWITRGGVERAWDLMPAPSWWRDKYRKGTPKAKFALAGGVAWVLFEDLVMSRVPPAADEKDAEWHVVGERGRAKAATPVADDTRDTEEDESGDEESRRLWSFTTSLGYSRVGGDGGFARGLRLERLTTANRKRPHVGAGGFAEAGSLGGHGAIGAGLSAGLLRLGAVASVGGSIVQDMTDRWRPQLVFSLFLGKRIVLDDAPLEAPVGLRFEMRPGTDNLPTTFMVATSLDVLVVSALGFLAAAM